VTHPYPLLRRGLKVVLTGKIKKKYSMENLPSREGIKGWVKTFIDLFISWVLYILNKAQSSIKG